MAQKTFVTLERHCGGSYVGSRVMQVWVQILPLLLWAGELWASFLIVPRSIKVDNHRVAVRFCLISQCSIMLVYYTCMVLDVQEMWVITNYAVIILFTEQEQFGLYRYHVSFLIRPFFIKGPGSYYFFLFGFWDLNLELSFLLGNHAGRYGYSWGVVWLIPEVTKTWQHIRHWSPSLVHCRPH